MRVEIAQRAAAGGPYIPDCLAAIELNLMQSEPMHTTQKRLFAYAFYPDTRPLFSVALLGFGVGSKLLRRFRSLGADGDVDDDDRSDPGRAHCCETYHSAVATLSGYGSR